MSRIENKKIFIGASATIIGTAVGAGIFGIPYVVAQSGVTIGLIHIAVLGAIMAVTLLAYGEVVLRTTGIHQLPGYAERYLGKSGKIAAVLALMFGMYGALIAYVIEVGHFLHMLLNPVFGGPERLYAFLFWLGASLIIITGLSMVVRFETWIVAGLIIVIIVFAILGMPHIDIQNWQYSDFSQSFIPYGVILFAFGAASAIPEVRRMLLKKRKGKLFPHVIWFAILTTALAYAVFAVTVVGITGGSTSESAIVGLGDALGPSIFIVGALFGILAMGSSFLVIGLALKQIFQYDFRQPKIVALGLALILPLIIYWLDLVSFVEILGIAGAVTGGFVGIIIWQIYRKAKTEEREERKPEYRMKFPPCFIWVIQAVFVLGIIYEVLRIFRFFD